MSDVPEADREATAGQVADKIIPELRAALAFRRAATPVPVTSSDAQATAAGDGCDSV